MAREAGRDPASIEITLFGLGEDLDPVKRLAEIGVARVVPMFPPKKADTVLPIVDRWANIMPEGQRVNLDRDRSADAVIVSKTWHDRSPESARRSNGAAGLGQTAAHQTSRRAAGRAGVAA